MLKTNLLNASLDLYSTVYATSQGYQLQYLSAYSINGLDYYAAIWSKPANASPNSEHFAKANPPGSQCCCCVSLGPNVPLIAIDDSVPQYAGQQSPNMLQASPSSTACLQPTFKRTSITWWGVASGPPASMQRWARWPPRQPTSLLVSAPVLPQPSLAAPVLARRTTLLLREADHALLALLHPPAAATYAIDSFKASEMASVNAQVASFMSKWGVPGMSISLAVKGTIQLSTAWGLQVRAGPAAASAAVAGLAVASGGSAPELPVHTCSRPASAASAAGPRGQPVCTLRQQVAPRQRVQARHLGRYLQADRGRQAEPGLQGEGMGSWSLRSLL